MPTPLPVDPPDHKSQSSQSSGPASGSGLAASGTSTKLEPPNEDDLGTLESGAIIAERYRINRLLGEGGMGKVYAAEHVHMRKQVAVKVLHPEMSTTPEIVARFEREAVAAGKIAHPNVAAATDFGRLPNGSFFLVLEHVAGTDLRAVIRKGAVSQERALRIIRQIVAAVAAAHAAGIIHRDLKPENIMLVEREDDPDFVKVLDFGIAKIDVIGIVDPGSDTIEPLSGSQPLTKMGTVFGTPDYMSPEQALGQTIDARSDLYSIGVMLYELLTGERPFKGGAVTLMRKHVLEAAPSLPSAVQNAIDPRFDLVIQKLLQKSAPDRYASAIELGTVLGELLSQPPPDVMVLSRASVVSRGSIPGSVSQTGPRSNPGSSSVSRDSFEDALPKKRGGGKGLLLLVLAGVAGVCWVGGITPHELWGRVVGRLESASTATPSAEILPPTRHAGLPVSAPAFSAVPHAASAPPLAPLVADDPPAASASAATALDFNAAPSAPASAAFPDPAPSDSSTSLLGDPDSVSAGSASAAPPSVNNAPSPSQPPVHHPGVHTSPGRPASKPFHKPGNKPSPKRTLGGVYLPPPSQWFTAN